MTAVQRKEATPVRADFIGAIGSSSNVLGIVNIGKAAPIAYLSIPLAANAEAAL